jgi:hypothetical protein
MNVIKQSLEQNALELKEALQQGNMQQVRDLMIQRANLKDMLINELETLLQDKAA